MVCVRGGTQAPRGNLMVSNRPTGRDAVPTNNYRTGSLLVSVEGEPKSFLPPALFIMLEQITNLGTNGMVYRRGQQIVLQNERTGEHVAVRVVMHDTRNGWLAENGEGDWQWYRINNEYWPDQTDYWKYVKKVGT